MKNTIRLIIIGIFTIVLDGCFLTKVVTVPMRVTGAVVSIVPGVGDVAHDAIDKSADILDKAPL